MSPTTPTTARPVPRPRFRRAPAGRPAAAGPAGPAGAAGRPGRAIKVAACALAAGLLVTAAATTAAATTAAAHTKLEASDPKDDARLDRPPGAVKLDFIDPVRGRYSQVAVLGPGRKKSYESGTPRVRDDTVTQALRPLGPAGTYTIVYRVIAVDGHPVTGTISFTLTRPGPRDGGVVPGAGTGTGTSGAAGSADRSGGGGGVPGWALATGVALVAVLLAGVALRLRRVPPE